MIDNYIALHERGNRTVAPTFIANALVDSCSGMIAIETGAIGHNVCMVSACATGTHNVGEAAEAIRRGDCIAVISGSTEAPLLEVGHAGFSNMRGMGMPRPGEAPQTVSRPFDLTRDGFVLGEGSGSLFLEDLELAKARGARIYAEVVGYGSAADGWDMIQPIDAGIGSSRAMQMALDRRGVPADEVDLINPHGTSTPLGDKREAEAIWTVFGERAAASAQAIAISATKSMTGHMMGAAGAFEAFATVKSVAEQCAPATINYRDPDPECDLWVVTETRSLPIRYALSNNIGLGGHNGASSSALQRRLTSWLRLTAAAVAHYNRGHPTLRTSVPERDPARRAVITGLGAIMPIGNDFPTYWSNLVAGVTGTRLIQSFDASAFEVRIAAEVLGFDPTIGDGPQDGPPDEPVHPPRDGRRQGGRPRFGHRLRGDDAGAARPRRASWSTPVAAGSRRSSTARTSTTRRVPASSAPSPSRRCRARWAPACCRWNTT